MKTIHMGEGSGRGSGRVRLLVSNRQWRSDEFRAPPQQLVWAPSQGVTATISSWRALAGPLQSRPPPRGRGGPEGPRYATGNPGSGRVNVLPGRSGPRRVTRGQLCYRVTSEERARLDVNNYGRLQPCRSAGSTNLEKTFI